MLFSTYKEQTMKTQPRHSDSNRGATLAQAFLYTKYRHSDGLTHEQAVAKLQEVMERISRRFME